MITEVKGAVAKLIDTGKSYVRPAGPVDPEPHFANHHYQRHNQRRQEHLATLGLPLRDKTVLEVGAGVGDHTTFFLDRGCTVTTSDARKENVAALRARFPKQQTILLDVDHPEADLGERFDIVYCYGLLYHLSRPAEAIAYMARHAKDLFLLETCVSFGDALVPNLTTEVQSDPTQAFHGTGCRPTRAWVVAELKKHFAHVYMPTTQPNHEQFPLDWSRPPADATSHSLFRAVFVASRQPIENPALVSSIPDRQTRS